jgi:hypothetical protein
VKNYDDDTAEPTWLPIPTGRRTPFVRSALTGVALQVAEANPRWGRRQVEAEVRRLGRGRRGR